MWGIGNLSDEQLTLNIQRQEKWIMHYEALHDLYHVAVCKEIIAKLRMEMATRGARKC